MDNLTKYQIIANIKENAKTIIYRGIRERDREQFILKMMKQEYPELKEIARFRHEYKIRKNLVLAEVVKAISLEKYNNALTMILEDIGGNSLDIFLKEGQLAIKEFLKIAIKITSALGKIHKANIIHKDINPSN
ncbi:MAG: protein kinase, partial [Prochloraceae cyanobacterium]